jgi:hypothetical protein
MAATAWNELHQAEQELAQVEAVTERGIPAYLRPFVSALQSLANAQDASGIYAMSKVTFSSILQSISTGEYTQLSAKFSEYSKKQVSLRTFIRLFLEVCDWPRDGRVLYNVAPLAEYFLERARQSRCVFLSWEDLSGRVINNSMEWDGEPENAIANRYLWKYPSEALRHTISAQQLLQVFRSFPL